MLWFGTCLESVENLIVRNGPKHAKAVLISIYGLPGLAQLKSLGALKLLRETCDLLESLGIVNFVVGGYAYDMSRGKIVRYHGDVDIAIIANDNMTRMFDYFVRHGFQVVMKKPKCQLQKHGRMIDIFYWYPSADGYFTSRCGYKCVRIPTCCFRYETKCLFGHAYRVASDEYAICIEPFVSNEKSLEYISQLKQNSAITCRCSTEEVVETITMYEFHCNNAGELKLKEVKEPRVFV